MEKIREQRNTICVCVITSFITTFMGSALNLSIPSLEEEFKAGAQTVGWVITIYMLTCSALAVPFGRLSDRVERRSIMRTGILVFCISSLTAVLSKRAFSRSCAGWSAESEFRMESYLYCHRHCIGGGFLRRIFQAAKG